jgi:hypothetical protein
MCLDGGMNTTAVAVGDYVTRKQGRPEDLGRRGTVVWLSDTMVIGTAGDVLARVRPDDGDSDFTCYVRQLVK